MSTSHVPLSMEIVELVEKQFSETKAIKQEERNYCLEGKHERTLIEVDGEIIGLACKCCTDIMEVSSKERLAEYLKRGVA